MNEFRYGEQNKRKIAHIVLDENHHHICYIVNEGSEDEAEEAYDCCLAYCGYEIPNFFSRGTLEDTVKEGAEICEKCLEQEKNVSKR